MASDAHAEQSHGSPLGPREYIYITIGLGIVTLVELALSYSDLATGPSGGDSDHSLGREVRGRRRAVHAPEFEARIFTQMFVLGLVLGASILLALIMLFWNDPSDALGGEELPPLEHSEESRELFIDTDWLL